MESRLDRILNHWVLLSFNILIVILIEATGDFFMMTGLVHLIAIMFIALGVLRIFIHYEVYDQYLRPFLYGGMITLIIFAASHVLEYVSYRVLYMRYDAIAANVVNLYLMGLLITIVSVDHFLRQIEKISTILTSVLYMGIIGCSALTVLFFVNDDLVRLSDGNWQMFAYALVVAVVTIWGIIRLYRLRGHVSIMVNFINYFVASFTLISASALFYVLSDVLVTIGVHYMQVMYISHFLFYGALSLMFLAYVRLAHLKGVYEGIVESGEPKKD